MDEPCGKVTTEEKSRLSCNNKDQLATINRRISELICENRKHLAARWLVENDYFHELCTDLNYIAPVDVVVGSEIEVPEISQRLIWKSLSNITRTTTGPDGIPFWV